MEAGKRSKELRVSLFELVADGALHIDHDPLGPSSERELSLPTVLHADPFQCAVGNLNQVLSVTDGKLIGDCRSVFPVGL
jgi:hypothetical protein